MYLQNLRAKLIIHLILGPCKRKTSIGLEFVILQWSVVCTMQERAPTFPYFCTANFCACNWISAMGPQIAQVCSQVVCNRNMHKLRFGLAAPIDSNASCKHSFPETVFSMTSAQNFVLLELHLRSVGSKPQVNVEMDDGTSDPYAGLPFCCTTTWNLAETRFSPGTWSVHWCCGIALRNSHCAEQGQPGKEVHIIPDWPIDQCPAGSSSATGGISAANKTVWKGRKPAMQHTSKTQKPKISTSCHRHPIHPKWQLI